MIEKTKTAATKKPRTSSSLSGAMVAAKNVLMFFKF
jgi:hypothetical protein